MPDDNLYIEQGWRFPPEFSEGTNPTCMVSEDDNIRQCLMVLFSTNTGERVHRYDYGFSLKNIAFEQDTLEMEVYIVNTIENMVRKFEPRVKVDNVFVNKDVPEKNFLEIRIVYTVLKRNSQDILTHTVRV